MAKTAPLRPGDPESLGDVRLLGRLGEGGQGVVFLGEREPAGPVAVKLLHSRFTGNPRARSNFARELAAARQVDPFCTARILAADVDGDVPYIVSEFIDGPSLLEVVESAGPRVGTALDRLAIGTATALTAIHRAGVVHRDFKPGNVIMGPDGPRVIDFGVARALDADPAVTSQVVGTPAYMAPEQVSGERPGRAADLFAWAATIAYAASGRSPFGDDFMPAVINRILHEDPDLEGLEEGLLAELVRACLDKDPDRRPTAPAVLLRLLGHDDAFPASATVDFKMSAHPGATRVLEQGAVAAEPERGHWRGWTLSVASAVVVAALTAVVIVLMMQPRNADAVAPSPSISTGPVVWLHGKLGLRLKTGWRVVDRGESATYVVTGGSCDGRSDECHGFLVLGPGGVAQGVRHGPYDGTRPYRPGVGAEPCRTGGGLVQGAARRLSAGVAPVADRTADFRAWTIECVPPGGGEVAARYVQREWYLPQSKILIVSWWQDVRPDDVLAGARWRV